MPRGMQRDCPKEGGCRGDLREGCWGGMLGRMAGEYREIVVDDADNHFLKTIYPPYGVKSAAGKSYKSRLETGSDVQANDKQPARFIGQDEDQPLILCARGPPNS